MKKLLAILVSLSVPAFAADYQPLVRATLYKVVTIRVRGIGLPELTIMDILHGAKPETGPIGFIGSGALISSDGIILTCDHLFLHEMKDRTITVTLSNGIDYKAIVLAEDKKKDLATIKIFPLHRLGHFVIGKPLHKGQEVLSFGAPYGIERTVSFGHVENLGVKDNDRQRTLHGASINPGSSGGPLVDTTGQLVGVNIETLHNSEAMHMAVSLKDIHSFLGE